MTRKELAEQYFNDGFNCGASVLGCFCEDYDLDTEQALRVAGSLGGGFTDGEICGAASGGCMVVGLKHGPYIQGDKGALANCHAKTAQYIEAFKQEHGALPCRELLSDKPDGDDEDSREERRLFCLGLVKSAVEILEELDY